LSARSPEAFGRLIRSQYLRLAGLDGGVRSLMRTGLHPKFPDKCRFTGNFRQKLLFGESAPDFSPDGQRLSGKFPTFVNREFFNASGNHGAVTANFAKKQGSAESINRSECLLVQHPNHEMLEAGHTVYSELKNLCVWNKTNGGMGSFYRSKHELVFVRKSGTAAHLNNFELGQHGRNRTNVWDYAGVNSFRSERMDELQMHPMVKPVALVADAIRDCSRQRDIVLDPFCGSGTILGYGLAQ
jgi:DNA methylase